MSQHDINEVWSKEWDVNARPGAIFLHRLFIEGYKTFRRYIPDAPEKILDVGAGTGRYGLRFAKEFPKAHVTITDILDESLRNIEANRLVLGVNNVTIQKESVLALSFPDATFDFVFCDVVIQHLPNYREAFTEMVRVLRPGGVLMVSTNNKWNLPHTAYKYAHQLFGRTYRYGFERSFTRGDLAQLARSSGLHIVALDGFYFAYGVYRWKEYWKMFDLVGRILNRISHLLDSLTRGGFSRYFGFEIFVVARK